MLAIRRNGIPTLFDDLDHFNNLFGVRPASPEDATPAVDVYDDGGRFVVTASLPGVGKENLDIELENNVLTISAKREVKEDERTWHRREIYHGSYSRSLKFGAPVDGSKVTAEYKDGLLTVSVPKEEKIKPRKIEIASN